MGNSNCRQWVILIVVGRPIVDNVGIVNIDQVQQSDWDNVTVTVTSIVFLDNGRMRWNLEYWNLNADDTAIQINYQESYLADESGNQYFIVGAENGIGIDYRITLRSGLKTRHWIEFDSPIDGARTFLVDFVEFGNSGVANFAQFEIMLP